MTTNNPSNNVPGQPSHGDPTTNPQPNVGTSGSQGEQSTPTLEELQAQLVAERAKNARFEDEAFKAREKERQRKQKELEDKTALEQKLKEQGEFRTLADQLAEEKQRLQQEIVQRDAEIAKRDYEALRAKVTIRHGLAPELAMRLNGATEEELNLDAAALKKLVSEQIQQARQPGNSPNPTPSSGELPRDQQKQAFKQRRSSSGAYGL